MYNNKAVLTQNPLLPNQVITIDPKLCIACYQCADVCRCNVIVHNSEKGQPPLLVYPDECWHCAVCTEKCPTGAIKFEHPINQKVTWKRKETGEFMRIGMKNAPEPNTRRAYGDDSIQLEENYTVNLKVLEVEKLSRFVVKVKLGGADRDSNNYKPGHFVNIQIDEDVYRGYSIGNAPGQDVIELYIDLFPNGKGGQFFKALEVGKEVTLTMPLGRFIYTPKETPALLVGSVTGISPVKAMIEEELFNVKSGRKLELLFLVWDSEDIFLKEYFDDLEKQYSNFSYSIILTNPETKAEKVGKILNTTITEYISQSETIDPEMDAYICGAKTLIKDVEKHLFRRDVFWKNIFYESFM
jgi:NAD(P)H-flavin reductase/NAD-dependent dihydropyrimidine dehydrogenase PreA subunit